MTFWAPRDLTKNSMALLLYLATLSGLISRGFNFANQPVFHIISFIFLGVLAKIAILKISRGQNFAKMANIRENHEN